MLALNNMNVYRNCVVNHDRRVQLHKHAGARGSTESRRKALRINQSLEQAMSESFSWALVSHVSGIPSSFSFPSGAKSPRDRARARLGEGQGEAKGSVNGLEVSLYGIGLHKGG